MEEEMLGYLNVTDGAGCVLEAECIDTLLYQGVTYLCCLPVDEEACGPEIEKTFGLLVVKAEGEGESAKWVTEQNEETAKHLADIFRRMMMAGEDE